MQVRLEIDITNVPQHSLVFARCFKQLRLEIGLKDALIEMPKFNKWLSGLLRNKEKLEEITITINLIGLNALADSGTSINLLPHSIYKQLGLGALTPTRMTLELANRSITHPMGIAEDVVESFASKNEIDEIDAFLAMEVSSNFKKGYFDSEGDLTFLKNLLSDDTTHNLAPEVISDHEPEQNESSINFSPRSNPLHHEFAGELLILPSRIVHEHEDYLNHDLIPPGVENDDSEDEDNELPNLDHLVWIRSFLFLHALSLPDVEKCLEPEAGILITKVFKGVSKPHDFMADILPTLPTLVSDLTFILFLSSFLSFGSEDTIFDPDIITFPFSYLEPVAFSMEVSCSKCCSP
ncbi:reverse transcriptase domain-containing protein [Tanacetum coccineum]